MALIKTPAEIEIMAEGGRKLAKVISALSNEVKSGVTTNFLDKLSFKLIQEAGAVPAFLGYKPQGAKKPYPKTLCASVNDTVVHGIPSDYIIKDGDLVKIDLGLKWRGLYVDSAVTVGVGRISSLAKNLMAVTKKSLDLAIQNALVGRTLGDIGYAISGCVRKNKFSVVHSLTGHGIGSHLHEDPSVFNVGEPHKGLELMEGMVLAIEPMVSSSDLASGCPVRELPDGSFATRDGSLSAHFEHTVTITGGRPIILTQIKNSLSSFLGISRRE